MSLQPEQLDREASLMLHLAGELPPAERQAFEQRLAGDPHLAEELRQLGEAQSAVSAGLEQADARQRLPLSQGVAARRVMRSIQQWQINRLMNPPQPQRKGLLLPWWSYPTAAAASLLIGFLVWSSNRPVGNLDADPIVQSHQATVADEAETTELASWLEHSLELDEGQSDDLMGEQFSMSGDDLSQIFMSPADGSSW